MRGHKGSPVESASACQQLGRVRGAASRVVSHSAPGGHGRVCKATVSQGYTGVKGVKEMARRPTARERERKPLLCALCFR